MIFHALNQSIESCMYLHCRWGYKSLHARVTHQSKQSTYPYFQVLQRSSKFKHNIGNALAIRAVDNLTKVLIMVAIMYIMCQVRDCSLIMTWV